MQLGPARAAVLVRLVAMLHVATMALGAPLARIFLAGLAGLISRGL